MKSIKGYLITADISGYTAFLTGNELEHSAAITQELLLNMKKQIRTPYRFIEAEGDALFYFANEEAVPEGDRILDHVEASYFQFVTCQNSMIANTTCKCAACRAINTLDLKFFIHFGEFMISTELDGKEKLIGPAVIMLHRLMKNSVKESTHLQAYALLTEESLAHTGKPGYAIDHRENYEHFGDINCAVICLKTAYERQKSKEIIYLKDEEADFHMEADFNATPETLWAYCIDAKRRLEWQGTLYKVKLIRNKENRFSEGGEAHCDHGSFKRFSRYLYLNPFHHFIMRSDHTPAVMIPPLHVQFQMEPLNETRTRLIFKVRVLRRDWFTMFFTRLAGYRLIRKEVNYNKLKEVLEREQMAANN